MKTRKRISDRDALAALFAWHRKHGVDAADIPQGPTRDALLAARDRGWLDGNDARLFITRHGIAALVPFGVAA